MCVMRKRRIKVTPGFSVIIITAFHCILQLSGNSKHENGRRLRDHFMKSTYFPGEDIEFTFLSNTLIFETTALMSTFRVSMIA